MTPRKKDNLVALVKEIMREGKNEEEGMLGLETQTPTSQQDQPSTSKTKKARKQVQQSVSASPRMDAPAYCNAGEKSRGTLNDGPLPKVNCIYLIFVFSILTSF